MRSGGGGAQLIKRRIVCIKGIILLLPIPNMIVSIATVKVKKVIKGYAMTVVS